MTATRSRAGVIINEHTLSAGETERHVDSLGRHFEFIHHDDLLDRLRHPRRRPFCLLTFDDGKRSGYTETAPELQRLGVPAVFYVTTRFLSDGTPLWFDRYEALIARVGAPPAGLEPHTIKRLPLALLTERLDRACALHDVTVDLEDDGIGPMTWEQARDLSRRGFTIGAHSVRHAVLTTEPETAALQDIEQSIADVTARIGVQCPTFAFPNGNYTARLARHAVACGVRTVMTTEPVWVSGQFPSWRLPRLQLFGSNDYRRTSLKLLAARHRLLVNPDGTGRLYRRIGRLAASDRGQPMMPAQAQSELDNIS